MTHTAADRGRLVPRARTGEAGVDAAAVTAFLDTIQAGGVEMHSLMLLRHGKVAAEGWWAPYAPDRVHLLYSLSKSFTSTAVGFCVAEGRFALDDRVVDLLPEHTPDNVAERVSALTVHHLLSMSTGHREDTLNQALSLEPHDVVRGFLRIPPEEPVGSRHAYNNSTTYVLAALVEKASGLALLDYLRPRLLDPLGIGAARWDLDEHGQAMGFTGLHLQTESIATFGQLLLQDGVWEGRRVLPEGWVELATRTHVDNAESGENPDWQQGYGYQFWMSRHGFRADGALGQFCVVVPELDLVVATTAFSLDMQVILDAVWAHLLPGASGVVGAAPDLAAEDELAERLAHLTLPEVEVDPEVVLSHSRTFEVADAGRLSPLTTGTQVTVTPDGDNTVVTMALSETTLTFGCGRSQWTEGSLDGTPVVCRGGWTDPETFEADLVLIETPHRIRLHASGIRLDAAWNTPPLTGPRIESQLPGAVWSAW
ncbi:MAG: beta-lactamase family protein [Actinomycetota bacterium]|nr:beta-lactamase family protein [Actinomycetota bacterium]